MVILANLLLVGCIIYLLIPKFKTKIVMHRASGSMNWEVTGERVGLLRWVHGPKEFNFLRTTNAMNGQPFWHDIKKYDRAFPWDRWVISRQLETIRAIWPNFEISTVGLKKVDSVVFDIEKSEFTYYDKDGVILNADHVPSHR